MSTWCSSVEIARSVSALQFTVDDPDTSRLYPPFVSDPSPSLNSNPDVNQSLFGTSLYECGTPAPDNDTGAGGPGTRVVTAQLLLYEHGGLPPFFPVTAASTSTLGTVHYNIPVSALPGDVTLSLRDAAIYDDAFIEIGSCNPLLMVEMPCEAATLHFIAFPGVAKIPEGNAANADAVGAEGEPVALRRAGGLHRAGRGRPARRRAVRRNVVTRRPERRHASPDGLGAYEFSVEYDNFVIQSVNPCDIVFGPAGAGCGARPGR